MACSTRCSSIRPDLSSKLVEATRASPSRTESLTLEEPTLTTRRRIALVRPGPVADFGRVLALGAGVRTGTHAFVGHPLAEPGSTRPEPGHPVDDVHDDVEAVEVVQHHHVERRRGGALLLVAAHVQV